MNDWQLDTPLRGELEKRRLQKQRFDEDARILLDSIPIPKPASPTKLTPMPKVLAALTERTKYWSKRQRHIAVYSLYTLAALCMLTALLIMSIPISEALVPLPAIHTSDVISYVKSVDVAVDHAITLPMPNGPWNASDGIQFGITAGSEKGTFLLLSYNSADQAGVDAFGVMFDLTYRSWHLTQLGTVLVLADPSTPDSLVNKMNSYLAELIIAPYRPNLRLIKTE